MCHLSNRYAIVPRLSQFKDRKQEQNAVKWAVLKSVKPRLKQKNSIKPQADIREYIHYYYYRVFLVLVLFHHLKS